MTLVVRPTAAADIAAIRAQYEEGRPGLGDEFVAALDQLFERLAAFPRSAPEVAGYLDVRRARVRGFPYAVFYRLDAARVHVLCLARSPRATTLVLSNGPALSLG